MPATFRNNANGGTNGTTVSLYNCGNASGDAWNYLSYGVGMTISYANAPARGGMAYKCTTGATASNGYVIWNTLPDQSTYYIRFAVYLPANPSSSFRFCEIGDDTTIGLSIGCTTAGKISVRDYNSSQMGLSTISLPTGRWARVEMRYVSSSAAGQMTLRIYTEVDSPYPAETLASAASFNTKPNAGYITQPRFGISTFNIANWTYYIDDIAVSDQGWLGPANASFLPSGTYYNGAEMGSNATMVTSLNTSSSDSTYFYKFLNPNTITFSTARAAHGSLSYFIQPTAGNSSLVQWASYATQSAAARMYIYLTAFPSDVTEFMQINTSEASFDYIGRLALNSTGKLIVYDASGAIWTSTASLSLNSWQRLELYGAIGGSSTTGTLQAAFYAGDSTTAIDSFSTSSANTSTAQAIGMLRFGKVTATSYATSFYMDDLAGQSAASGFIGPYSGALTPPATFAGIIPHLGWGREA